MHKCTTSGQKLDFQRRGVGYVSVRDPNVKTGGGGGGGGCSPLSANSTSGGGGGGPSADLTSGKAHFWSIEKVDGCCPDQLAFN